MLLEESGIFVGAHLIDSAYAYKSVCTGFLDEKLRVVLLNPFAHNVWGYCVTPRISVYVYLRIGRLLSVS